MRHLWCVPLREERACLSEDIPHNYNLFLNNPWESCSCWFRASLSKLSFAHRVNSIKHTSEIASCYHQSQHLKPQRAQTFFPESSPPFSVLSLPSLLSEKDYGICGNYHNMSGRQSKKQQTERATSTTDTALFMIRMLTVLDVAPQSLVGRFLLRVSSCLNACTVLSTTINEISNERISFGKIVFRSLKAQRQHQSKLDKRRYMASCFLFLVPSFFIFHISEVCGPSCPLSHSTVLTHTFE